MNQGLLAGLIVACILLVAAVACAVFFALSWLKKRKEHAKYVAELKQAQNDAQSLLSQGESKRQSLVEEGEKYARQLLEKTQSDCAMKTKEATLDAQALVKNGQVEADRIKLAAQSEADALKRQAQKEGDDYLSAKKDEANQILKKVEDREEAVDKRDAALTQKEQELDKKSAEVQTLSDQNSAKEKELSEKEASIDSELSRVANLSLDEAKRELMAKVEERSATEIAEFLKDRRDEAEDKAEAEAKNILAGAIERYSQDMALEHTTTNVSLPSDDMKGRIIGREGRNIKSLESILGVDILIDDTPEVLTISCFNPIRREIAVRTLQALIKDGRIQPGRIEETCQKMTNSVEAEIRRTGEDVVMQLGLPRINKDLCYYIGRLKFRTSFGQNALDHSIQVAELTGMMAAELGLDQTIAKRCGLLHDIGKSADFEAEGSHVEIGVRLAKKYGEPDQVISAIASHHGDCEKRYLTDELVVAADTLSAARPGARSETLENYIKRVEDIEKICGSYDGVQTCYALQSGRDVRVMVTPEKIDDKGIIVLAQKIRDRIQNEMVFPGNIKITVIRENRAIEIAK